MRFLDVIFFYYYSFFKNCMPFEVTPEFSALIGICTTFYFAILGIIGVPLALAGKAMLLITAILIGAGIFFILYRYFMRLNNWRKIVRDKPLIKNKKVSISITILFFVLGMICSICGPLLMKYVLLDDFA
ncbi:MAG: hypothetical protein IJ622_07335 [Bacteroidales bacterium]|nr:hypothetical protein [Bacteroidales bacterium]